jgi:general secretion pathway protein H
MSRAGAAEAGFTLVELLVVLVLLGLLTAVAAPRLATLRQPSLTDVGRGVSAQLRGYRILAMRSGRAVPAELSTYPLPQGFALAPEEGEGPTGPVIFLPDGRSSGGSFLLVGPNDQARIAVDWLTGEVRVLR